MRLLKITCFALTISIAFCGCSSGTGADGDEETDEPSEYSLTVSATPSEGGSVDPASGTFTADSTITVEATVNEGWEFVNWTGDQESEENPLSFSITEDTEITANFDDQRSMYTLALD